MRKLCGRLRTPVEIIQLVVLIDSLVYCQRDLTRSRIPTTIKDSSRSTITRR
jgi:hypothetical protein